MLVILVLGLLTQNGHAIEPNQTELLAALKLFERILNKDKIEEITVVPPMSKPAILSYIHNLNPELLTRPGDANLHDDHHLPLLVDPRENTEKPIVVKEEKKEVIDNIIDSKLKANSINTQNSRKILTWFKNLFGATTTTTAIPIPPKFENLKMDAELRARNIENNLTAILSEIQKELQKFNENLERRNSNNMTTGFLVLKVPVQSPLKQSVTIRRRKRELQNNTTEKQSDNNSNVIQITESESDNEKKSNVTVITGNRRMMNVIPVQNLNNFNRPIENLNVNYGASELKEKLIKLIAESFKDIKQKISPLKALKDKYSGDDLYVVGYVMASIDTLEVNLNKIIDEMEMKKLLYNESKLMELFERLNTSNNVISRLMNSLKKYTDLRS